MKIEITAPYGNVTAEGDSMLHAMVGHWIDQLKYFQKRNDTEEIRKDLTGYAELLTATEETIRLFCTMKNDARMGLRPKKWNDDLVQEIKDLGKWVSRE